jgi:repressor LexA
MNQFEFAEFCDISRSSVARYDAGQPVDRKNAEKIASACGVSVDYVLGYGPEIAGQDGISIKRGAVPIIGEIACGTPITAEQNIEGYADLPDGVRADFALKCKGDSMIPTFENGDLVLIRKQPDVEEGQIAAVNVRGETTLKHVYHRQSALLLVADNPKYQPIYAPLGSDEEVVIHGLAVGYVRLFE